MFSAIHPPPSHCPSFSPFSFFSPFRIFFFLKSGFLFQGQSWQIAWLACSSLSLCQPPECWGYRQYATTPAFFPILSISYFCQNTQVLFVVSILTSAFSGRRAPFPSDILCQSIHCAYSFFLEYFFLFRCNRLKV